MPEMCRKTIIMPQAIHSTYQGYLDLLEIFQCYVDERNAYSEITMNFRGNTWFDANLLPIYCQLYTHMLNMVRRSII